MEHKHTGWLDDIIVVSKGNMDKREAEVQRTMTKLEQTGYRLNPKKMSFSKKVEWVGHEKINKELDHSGTNLKRSP